MILDYNFNKNTRDLTLSYIDENGNKKLLRYNNQNRFKAFYHTPNGKYTTWDGAKCDIKYTDNPSKFDIKRFILERDEQVQTLLNGTVYPKMYAWDIENTFNPNEEPDPVGAKNPITTISVVAPDLTTVVLGIIKLDEAGLQYVEENFKRYLDECEYFKTLDLPMPRFRYLFFNREEDMLEYFLKNIVAKVPILAGWNSIGYDWIYVCNRIKNYFPKLSIKMGSITGETFNKQYEDLKGDKIYYPNPCHTVIYDLMEIVKSEDKTVLPIKESMALNYIAHESIGVEKVEYEGDLMELMRTDPAKYVYYNAIDSVLVQLIEHRFKLINILSMYGLLCTERLDMALGTIALAEAIVFKDLWENNLQVVYEENDKEKGTLVGAYVKQPIPGKYEYISCNDFASLYPSTEMTCNLSYDNFVGGFYDEEKLAPYCKDKVNYVVVCGRVYENEKDSIKPKAGKLLHTFLDEEKLAPYRKDLNYFVTVNGNVYKNDRQYSLPRIMTNLKIERNKSKYLSKEIDATVLLDIEHMLEGKRKAKVHEYSDKVVKELQVLGFNFKTGEEFRDKPDEELKEIKRRISVDAVYHQNREQSIKLLMNGMYGGTSNPGFYWFNNSLANDVTAESKTTIHLMEDHFQTFWNENWAKMDEYHHRWGITVDKSRIPMAIKNSPTQSLATIVYGDTDSLYISYAPLLSTIVGFDKLTPREKMDLVVKINTDFLNKHNFDYIKEYYDARHGHSVHEFELETIARAGIWLNVKKHYAQIIMWKDGKIYDEDEYTVKSKGLEIIKSSSPLYARLALKYLIKELIMSDSKYLLQELNCKMLEIKNRWMAAEDIENISGAVSVHKYTQYVEDDTENQCIKGAPWNVKALCYYNYLIHKNRFTDDPIYGGKLKWYKAKKSSNKDNDIYFVYQSHRYPKWAAQLAPIDRSAMFQQCVLDPLNRVLTAIGMNALNSDGSIQATLF